MYSEEQLANAAFWNAQQQQVLHQQQAMQQQAAYDSSYQAHLQSLAAAQQPHHRQQQQHRLMPQSVAHPAMKGGSVISNVFMPPPALEPLAATPRAPMTPGHYSLETMMMMPAPSAASRPLGQIREQERQQAAMLRRQMASEQLKKNQQSHSQPDAMESTGSDSFARPQKVSESASSQVKKVLGDFRDGQHVLNNSIGIDYLPPTPAPSQAHHIIGDDDESHVNKQQQPSQPPPQQQSSQSHPHQQNQQPPQQHNQHQGFNNIGNGFIGANYKKPQLQVHNSRPLPNGTTARMGDQKLGRPSIPPSASSSSLLSANLPTAATSHRKPSDPLMPPPAAPLHSRPHNTGSSNGSNWARKPELPKLITPSNHSDQKAVASKVDKILREMKSSTTPLSAIVTPKVNDHEGNNAHSVPRYFNFPTQNHNLSDDEKEDRLKDNNVKSMITPTAVTVNKPRSTTSSPSFAAPLPSLSAVAPQIGQPPTFHKSEAREKASSKSAGLPLRTGLNNGLHKSGIDAPTTRGPNLSEDSDSSGDDENHKKCNEPPVENVNTAIIKKSPTVKRSHASSSESSESESSSAESSGEEKHKKSEFKEETKGEEEGFSLSKLLGTARSTHSPGPNTHPSPKVGQRQVKEDESEMLMDADFLDDVNGIVQQEEPQEQNNAIKPEVPDPLSPLGDDDDHEENELEGDRRPQRNDVQSNVQRNPPSFHHKVTSSEEQDDDGHHSSSSSARRRRRRNAHHLRRDIRSSLSSSKRGSCYSSSSEADEWNSNETENDRDRQKKMALSSIFKMGAEKKGGKAGIKVVERKAQNKPQTPHNEETFNEENPRKIPTPQSLPPTETSTTKPSFICRIPLRLLPSLANLASKRRRQSTSSSTSSTKKRRKLKQRGEERKGRNNKEGLVNENGNSNSSEVLMPPPKRRSSNDVIVNQRGFENHEDEDEASRLLNEAQRLKKEAGGFEGDHPAQVLKYLQSTLAFCLYAESIKEKKGHSYHIYRQALELLINMCRQLPSGTEGGKVTTKINILCHRCQSLLYLKLYKMRRLELQECQKILGDTLRKASKEPSNSSNDASSPSNHAISPTPSPAGSEVSTASRSSGYTSAGENNGNAHLSVPHAVMQKQHQFCNFLSQCHELWERADLLIHRGRCEDFVATMDRACGWPLTLHSSIKELVHYTRTGIALIDTELKPH